MTAHQDRNENPPKSANKPEVKTTSLPAAAAEVVTGLQIQDLNPLLPALLLPKAKSIKEQQHKADKPEVRK